MLYLLKHSLLQQSHFRQFQKLYSTTSLTKPSTEFQELCHIVSSCIGGLDELEASLNTSKASITPTLVTQIIDSCKTQAPTRRLLRFFSWCRKNPGCEMEDDVFNYVVRVFAEIRDVTAMDILVSDLRKENRTMETETFSVVSEILVKMGREDEAVGLFKNLGKFKCPRDRITVSAIVQALCAKGHAKKAEGVVFHHRSKISGMETCIYKSILHGWCVHGNIKEARRIVNEMKSLRLPLDLFCYNTILRCLCKRNLKFNPSALVPEATNLMMEMRFNKVSPTAVSFNILLSCLGKTRRVKEAYQTLHSMKKFGCTPDWVSYYLVIRVLYLSGRFGRGNQLVDQMIEDGFLPEPRFYYDLIGVLCGVERVGHALELFERMKKNCLGDYGPVYDLLIPKLCSGGEFEKGRQLWDDAVERGVILRCPNDVLDPSITEVYKPTKKIEEVSVEGRTVEKSKKNKQKKKDVKKKKDPSVKKKKDPSVKKKKDPSAS